MILRDLTVRREDFERGTGWHFEPRGACRGAVCVPLDAPPDEEVDAAAVAARLGMALVADAAHGVWALGPSTATGRVLADAEAPDLELPDMEGRPFRLSSLRGSKVVLVAWAPF